MHKDQQIGPSSFKIWYYLCSLHFLMFQKVINPIEILLFVQLPRAVMRSIFNYVLVNKNTSCCILSQANHLLSRNNLISQRSNKKNWLLNMGNSLYWFPMISLQKLYVFKHWHHCIYHISDICKCVLQNQSTYLIFVFWLGSDVNRNCSS